MQAGNNSQNDQKSLLESHREIIVDIESAIDTTEPRKQTDNSLEKFSDMVTEIITWIRNSCEDKDFKAGKDAVLENLRDARTKLEVAREEYEKKGRTQKFYNLVNKEGRAFLEKALKAW